MSATVIGDYTVGPATGSSLLTSLVAFWKLEEASGTRVDEVGNNDLSDNNTVTQAAGKIGNAAQFTAINSESLSITDNTDLSTPSNIDYTFAGWVYFDSVTGLQTLWSKYSGSQNEYVLWMPGAAAINYRVYNPGEIGTVTSSVTLSTSTWYFVVIWHDGTNNQVGIQVNNGTPDTAGCSAAIADSTGPFEMGNTIGITSPFNGRIDAVGFWKRLLTADEKTALYNSGNGIEYPF